MVTYSLEEKVKWFAILSRFVITVLQFLMNIAIPDHDADAFRKPFESNVTGSVDYILTNFLDGLTKWDAQYFLHIAQYGYTYENTLAFFPLFPLLVRQLSTFMLFTLQAIFFFIPIKNFISDHSALLLSAAILNNLIFIRTSVIFFKLSLNVLKNEKLSYVASILFCINPASIFFTAAYSESVYCFLVFYGLFQMELNNFFLSSIAIGLSGFTRSNGVINIGFICYSYIKLRVSHNSSWLHDIKFSMCIVVAALPFALYQLYCYFKYCLPGGTSLPQFIVSYGVENSFVFPGSKSSWCNNPVPFAYSYVQKHYWNVGFLQYYEVKQIPNFLLALPVFVIIAIGCFSYIKLHKSSLLYLGLVAKSQKSTFPISSLVYVLHCIALSVFAIFMIHIQVATRLLFSSSPVPYWFSAWLLSKEIPETTEGFVLNKSFKRSQNIFVEKMENRISKWKNVLFSEHIHGVALFIKYYYLVYYFVGTIAFSNFLPWT